MAHQADVKRIEEAGNLPEHWLEFLTSCRKSLKNKEELQALLSLYEQAKKQIPQEMQKGNVHFAKLLIDNGKLQSKVDPNSAKASFMAARNCCDNLAIVYIASAEFELRQGNNTRCKQMLRKGKECKAQPVHLISKAYKNFIEQKKHLIDEVTEEQTFFEVVKQECLKNQDSQRKSSDTDTSGGSVFSDSGEHNQDVFSMKLPTPPVMSTVCPILPSHHKTSPESILPFKPPSHAKSKAPALSHSSHSSSSGDDASESAPYLLDSLFQRGCMSAQKHKSTPAGKKELKPVNSGQSARKPRPTRALADRIRLGPPLRIPPSVKEQSPREDEVFNEDKENQNKQKPSVKQSNASMALKELNTQKQDTGTYIYETDGVKPLLQGPVMDIPKTMEPLDKGVSPREVLSSFRGDPHEGINKKTSQVTNSSEQQPKSNVPAHDYQGSLPSLCSSGSFNGHVGGMERGQESNRYANQAPNGSNASLAGTFSCDVVTVNGKKYMKQEMLGKGGSSKVFQCKCFESGKAVAIKYVSLDDADDAIIQSYLNEITLLNKLQGKENIIELFDWEFNKRLSTLYLVMERGDVDLNMYIRKNRDRMHMVTLISIWQQMLQAVQVIHEEGIIHCDLKPANFLSVSGVWKLIDFGISNAVQDDNTSIFRDTHVGTLNYMSPEAFLDISPQTGQGKPQMKIGRPSDVWSLGCILYLIVYGKTPFQHITNNFMKRQAIIDPNHVIAFPENRFKNRRLQEAMKGCLVRDPTKRRAIPYLLSQINFMLSGDDLISRLLNVASPRTAMAIEGLMENVSRSGDS